jgi:hypothetical protein
VAKVLCKEVRHWSSGYISVTGALRTAAIQVRPLIAPLHLSLLVIFSAI